jgi:diguanylate cyclase (GGDEF)-like protein/PAS domain S-box-containing protein
VPVAGAQITRASVDGAIVGGRVEPGWSARWLPAVAAVVGHVGHSGPLSSAEYVAAELGRLLGVGVAVWLAASGSRPVVAGRDVPDAVCAKVTGLIEGPAPARDLPWQRLDPPAWPDAGEVVLIPVRATGGTTGAVAVIGGQARPAFGPDELWLVQVLADLIGLSVHRAKSAEETMVVYQELRRQSELVDNVSDAVISIDPYCGVVSWNSAAEQIYRYTAGDAAGCELFSLLATRLTGPDGDPVGLATALAEAAREGEWRGEARERRSDGEEVRLLTTYTAQVDADGSLTGYMIVNRDVTEQRQEAHRATHDDLTGLPNRVNVAERLRQALLRAAVTGQEFAVMFVDLDGFKAVNDAYGHHAGDVVLQETARRLVKVARGEDLVGRLGGDEFVIIAEDMDRQGANELANRLLAATSQPVITDSHILRTLPSIGVAMSGSHASADDLLHAADTAMYHAKRERQAIAFAS